MTLTFLSAFVVCIPLMQFYMHYVIGAVNPTFRVGPYWLSWGWKVFGGIVLNASIWRTVVLAQHN